MVAWIIGWALILEYAIGNIVVAISWSGYFNNLLEHVFHIHLPDWMLVDPQTAIQAFDKATAELQQNAANLSAKDMASYQFAIKAYNEAPRFAGSPVFLTYRLLLSYAWLPGWPISALKKVSNLPIIW
ncbi:hypothetical protein LWM68_25810 [Niabella sp. W65]|nr:hypothetical protein [Niabella sp. W65]MCH7365882.1 hypothetical protein [Niabella sp. W65]